MVEGLRLDNLTKNPLSVTSRYTIPANGSITLTESEYLQITDEIVHLADFEKLSYIFIPIDKKELFLKRQATQPGSITLPEAEATVKKGEKKEEKVVEEKSPTGVTPTGVVTSFLFLGKKKL